MATICTATISLPLTCLLFENIKIFHWKCQGEGCLSVSPHTALSWEVSMPHLHCRSQPEWPMSSICSLCFLGDSLLFILHQLYRPERRCLQRTKNDQQPCVQRNHGMMQRCFIQPEHYHMILCELTSVLASVTGQRHITTFCCTEASHGNGPILPTLGPMWTPLFEYGILYSKLLFWRGGDKGL